MSKKVPFRCQLSVSTFKKNKENTKNHKIGIVEMN